MAVRAIGSKRNDNVRTNSPHVTNDALDHLVRVRPIEVLVWIVEQRDLVHS
jgi:hypothetical protein